MVIVLQGIRETTLLTLHQEGTIPTIKQRFIVLIVNLREIYCQHVKLTKKKLNFPALTGQDLHRQVHQIKIVHMKKMITIFIRKSEKEREILKGGTGINVTKPEHQESLT